ncbi:MAG: ABC transporter permease subunit [Clostridiaceae bacterium]|nr:ABC transporter permease subunit [Clostridiales bacterium]MDD6877167.1 ABC transporter permease subunit [Clostridiaceae bacterium]MDY3286415.1 ABC transporter permease subunit [Eubacteriales bacterium]MDY5015311.1 ABC transporter permease subunit [Eubacteriales bacterium]
MNRTSKAPAPPSGKKSSCLWKTIRSHKAYYFFLLPTIIYLAVFCYAPMYGIQIAFKNYNGMLGIWGSKWVGLRHFRDFFGGYFFKQIFGNTLILSLYSTAVGFPIPIFVALLLNEIRCAKYKKFVQTVLYAPHFISTVVMVGIIIMVLSPTSGLINYIIVALGGEAQYFMIHPSAFRHIYVWSGVWQGMGWSAIIYLAALSSVDPELHEAATIDGASRFQRICYINFPTIKPTIIILLIMSIGSLVGVGFEKTYLLQNDLNSETSEVISTFVYKRGLLNASYSFSTAVGLFNNIINVILLLIANGIARWAGETSLF